VTRARRIRWYALFVAPTLALAAVLLAIWAGGSPRRLWPVAGFLMAWAGSAAYRAVANRALRRRMSRQQRAPVPRDVQLTKPLWIRLDELLTLVGVASIAGTVAAALGFSGVGVGILLVAVAAIVFGRVTAFGTSGFTFESAGLRVHLGAASCLVPWGSIREVETMGPDQFVALRMVIDDVDEVCEGVAPSSPRNRKRAQMLLSGRTSRGEVLFMPWTGGIEGQTLARAIREGMGGGRPDRTN
jgi:hypothetical protein